MSKREIKFRAYVKNGRMIPWEELIGLDVGTVFQNQDAEGYRVMQFTGLKDRDGQDIYEDDIIEMDQWHPRIYRVGFLEGGFCFRARGNCLATDINMIQDSRGVHCKVIGNIYENAQLYPEPSI